MQRATPLAADLASRSPAPLHTIIITVRVLEKLGHSVDALLDGSGITTADLIKPDLIVSHAQELIVLANALRVTEDESIGLTIGKAIPVTAYGARGHAMLVSPTLRDALNLAYAYPLLAITYFKSVLHEYDDDAVITIGGYAYRSDLRILNTAMCVGASVREVSDLVQPLPAFKRITFDFPRPSHPERYEALLGCEVLFDMPSTSIVMPRRYLSSPLFYHHEIEYEVARNLCEQRERELRAWKPDRIVTRALQCLHEYGGVLKSEELAGLIGVSHRGMQREFERAGVSYRRLRDEVRRARALEYHGHAGSSAKALARELGYGSTYALKRAKARWDGR
ncbi:AraC family transcriptional regulator [Burkholderia stagnalis]|uniref:AraC family transcriptional regulator n=1 Tax=Burkholderia stagnalis TaxID=1503054 RepID=UPI00075A999E|nr:AraC family transcriptional regulator [Burkholderia stagnalis]KVN05735.1 hypothetical protein WT07_06465 [Burkholderia stagnalis]KWD97149.1 hypothetical protein WT47_28690 [Burkholderia stagnalis]KWE12263.1 hypothetical protein WT48_23400 [Burkholderia stagnalis]KWO75607.1 hypothetical protein WU00_11850 [Burkholderia stagnalis]